MPTRISCTSCVSMRSSAAVHALRLRALLCCWNCCRHWKALRRVCAATKAEAVTGAHRVQGWLGTAGRRCHAVEGFWAPTTHSFPPPHPPRTARACDEQTCLGRTPQKELRLRDTHTALCLLAQRPCRPPNLPVPAAPHAPAVWEVLTPSSSATFCQCRWPCAAAMVFSRSSSGRVHSCLLMLGCSQFCQNFRSSSALRPPSNCRDPRGAVTSSGRAGERALHPGARLHAAKPTGLALNAKPPTQRLTPAGVGVGWGDRGTESRPNADHRAGSDLR